MSFIKKQLISHLEIMAKTILGTVKYFQPRTEGKGDQTVWFFTVTTVEGGESGRLIPVEIEGSSFVGMV
jgi:hypothetical protein